MIGLNIKSGYLNKLNLVTFCWLNTGKTIKIKPCSGNTEQG